MSAATCEDEVNNNSNNSANSTAPAQSDGLSIFCREVRNLLRSKPNCMIPFSKFVPAYHNHYGRQCCVYQFGYTKLIELLESIPHVVQIIGDGTNRYITLTHREQIKRFASDLIKVVKSQAGKRLRLSKFAAAYEQVLGRSFRIEDYGTDNINVLLAEIWEGTINIIPIKRQQVEAPLLGGPPPFTCAKLSGGNPVLEQLVASNGKLASGSNNKPYITEAYPDCWFEIPKRERSEKEIKRTKYFVWDIIELLGKMEPDYSVAFSKFIPSYHYYFNRQCKVSVFGFSKLIDLFESISPDVVEILDMGPGEEKVIRLSEKRWPSVRRGGAGRAQSRRCAAAAAVAERGRQTANRSPAKLSYNGEATDEFSSDCQDEEEEEAEDEEEEADGDEDDDDDLEGQADDRILSAPQAAIDRGLTEEELLELEDELEAYEELKAIQGRRSSRMAAILDIFKYSIY